MEEKRKRKEWIKTVAIIFLAVLLVLTFFSNTIKNYSLPEVSAQYTNSGSITNKVRGTGTVDAADPYSVVYKSSRKVASVEVAVGDTVEKGDVLYTLEAGDSDELKEAEKTLESLKNAYEKAVVTGQISTSVTNKVEDGDKGTMEENQAAIAAAQKKVDKAQADADAVDNGTDSVIVEQEKIIADAETTKKSWDEQNTDNAEALGIAKGDCKYTKGDTTTISDDDLDGYEDISTNYLDKKRVYELSKSAYDSQVKVYNAAKTKSDAARAKADAAANAASDYLTVSGNDASDPEYITLSEKAASLDSEATELEATTTTEKNELDTLKATMDSDKLAYDEATKVYNYAVAYIKPYQTAVNNSKAQIANYEAIIAAAEAAIEARKTEVQTALTKAKDNYTEVTGQISSVYDLAESYAAIEEQEAKVAELKGEQGGTEITAPVSGTVLSLAYKAGETINSGDTVSTMQIAGKGYTLSMTVTAEQARLISVGDEAEVSNSWWYSDVHARVSAIKPDPSNPSTSKLVVFELDGDVSDGQSLTLTVGSRTANYDTIVPNSAIREDNNGKFVLKVNSKSTPLGNRYIAERVDVTILASDDTQSAVSGALEGWEYIITNSSKPVEDGTEVRLKD